MNSIGTIINKLILIRDKNYATLNFGAGDSVGYLVDIAKHIEVLQRNLTQGWEPLQRMTRQENDGEQHED